MRVAVFVPLCFLAAVFLDVALLDVPDLDAPALDAVFFAPDPLLDALFFAAGLPLLAVDFFAPEDLGEEADFRDPPEEEERDTDLPVGVRCVVEAEGLRSASEVTDAFSSFAPLPRPRPRRGPPSPPGRCSPGPREGR